MTIVTQRVAPSGICLYYSLICFLGCGILAGQGMFTDPGDQADSTESSDSVDMVAATAAPCREGQYSLGDGCSDCAENCTTCNGRHTDNCTETRCSNGQYILHKILTNRDQHNSTFMQGFRGDGENGATYWAQSIAVCGVECKHIEKTAEYGKACALCMDMDDSACTDMLYEDMRQWRYENRKWFKITKNNNLVVKIVVPIFVVITLVIVSIVAFFVCRKLRNAAANGYDDDDDDEPVKPPPSKKEVTGIGLPKPPTPATNSQRVFKRPPEISEPTPEPSPVPEVFRTSANAEEDQGVARDYYNVHNAKNTHYVNTHREQSEVDDQQDYEVCVNNNLPRTVCENVRPDYYNAAAAQYEAPDYLSMDGSNNAHTAQPPLHNDQQQRRNAHTQRHNAQPNRYNGHLPRHSAQSQRHSAHPQPVISEDNIDTYDVTAMHSQSVPDLNKKPQTAKKPTRLPESMKLSPLQESSTHQKHAGQAVEPPGEPSGNNSMQHQQQWQQQERQLDNHSEAGEVSDEDDRLDYMNERFFENARSSKMNHREVDPQESVYQNYKPSSSD